MDSRTGLLNTEEIEDDSRSSCNLKDSIRYLATSNNEFSNHAEFDTFSPIPSLTDAAILGSSSAKKSEDEKAYPVMLGMATGNPKYKVTQKEALAIAMAAPACANLRNALEKIYSNSRISTRYMAIPDFTPDQREEGDENFFPDNRYSLPVQVRQDKYKEVAVPLVTDICERAIAQAGSAED